MDYLSSIVKLIEQEKDNCWQYKQRTSALTETADYTRNAWDDEASRNLWNKFVYPFTDDAVILSDSKKELVENTDDIIKNSKVVFDNSISVVKLSDEIDNLMKEADREHTTSATCHDKGGQFLSKIQKLSPSVDAGYNNLEKIDQKFRNLYAKRSKIY